MSGIWKTNASKAVVILNLTAQRGQMICMDSALRLNHGSCCFLFQDFFKQFLYNLLYKMDITVTCFLKCPHFLNFFLNFPHIKHNDGDTQNHVIYR